MKTEKHFLVIIAASHELIFFKEAFEAPGFWRPLDNPGKIKSFVKKTKMIRN